LHLKSEATVSLPNEFLTVLVPNISNLFWLKDPLGLLSDRREEITSTQIAFIVKDLVKKPLYDFVDLILKFLVFEIGFWIMTIHLRFFSFFPVHSRNHVAEQVNHYSECCLKVFIA